MWTWPSDLLASIYLFCFAFGLIFSAFSVVLRARVGRVHLPIGHSGGGHGAHISLAGHHGQLTVEHGHAATHAPGGDHRAMGEPSPFNLSSIMVFLLWFGATGYILHVYYGALAGLSLVAAALIGWIGAALIYLTMSRVLWRGQTELDPLNYQVTGAVGRVTSSIHAGGTGEVIYELDGKRRVDGARSLDGTPLPAGTEVAIVRYRNGLVYVCPLTLADQQEDLV